MSKMKLMTQSVLYLTLIQLIYDIIFQRLEVRKNALLITKEILPKKMKVANTSKSSCS